MPPKENSPAAASQPAGKRCRPRKEEPAKPPAAKRVSEPEPESEPEPKPPQPEKTLSEGEGLEVAEPDVTPKADKPKRGRPLGKAKPASAPAKSTAAALSPSNGEPPAKRPRGRPPKPHDPSKEIKKVASGGQKRGRGRPKKSPLKGANTATDANTDATSGQQSTTIEQLDENAPVGKVPGSDL